MGATEVTRLEKLLSPRETVETCFARVQSSDVMEFGSDPYSGSFGTIRGVMALAQKAMPSPMAYAIGDWLLSYDEDELMPPSLRRRIDRLVRPQKWDFAVALPVLDDAVLRTSERKVTLTHSLPQLYGKEWDALLAEKLKLDPASTWLQNSKVESDTQTARVEVTRPTGTRTLTFGLKSSGDRWGMPSDFTRAIREIDEPTEAKALAAGKRVLALAELSESRFANLKLEVEPRVRREGGLGEIAVVTKRRVTKLTATIQTATKDTEPTAAWYFIGIAAC